MNQQARQQQQHLANRRKSRLSLAPRPSAASAAPASPDAARPPVEGENHMMVSVRTRPLSGTERERGERNVVRSYCQDKVVSISKEGRQGAVLKSEMGATHEYQFDKVLGPESTQQEVYEATTRELVMETLRGKNCTVFAYGATGAGKTHTMMGNEQDPGIMPRALIDMFRGIEQLGAEFTASNPERTTREWSVKLSYLEVYNETIYDLLTEKQRPLQPCEDPNDFRVKVLGLTEVTVCEVGEVLKLLSQGNTRRRMESTAANQVSSRSHAVIQVNVECIEIEQPPPPVDGQRRRLGGEKPKRAVTTSTLSLIDLAGSERAASTQNRGARLREGANINRSLLALANCINALSSKKASRVKYRDSKLTHLLKSSLEGSCCLSMIAAINPSHKCYEESHNTLKYANRAKDIKIRGSAATNKRALVDSEEATRIDDLVAENQELRERLSLTISRLSSTSVADVDVGRRASDSKAVFSTISETDREGDSLEASQAASPEAESDASMGSPNGRAVADRATWVRESTQSATAGARGQSLASVTSAQRQSIIVDAWNAPDMDSDANQHGAPVHASMEAIEQLRARVGALDMQNRTLAQLAASKSKVSAKKLVSEVEKAAQRALEEQRASMLELQAALQRQQAEIAELHERNRQLEMESAQLRDPSGASFKSARSAASALRTSLGGASSEQPALAKENAAANSTDDASHPEGAEEPRARSKKAKSRRESFIPRPGGAKSKKRLSTDGQDGFGGPQRIKQKVDHDDLDESALPQAVPPPPVPTPCSADSTPNAKGCLSYPRLRLRKPR